MEVLGASGLKHMELTQGLTAPFLVGEQVLMTRHAEENVGVQEVEGEITFSEFRKSKMDCTLLKFKSYQRIALVARAKTFWAN